ncbi:MAG TPA: histidine kinase N-terminal 7TM domain-containing protein, partial [Anaerolineaceae bacterium]|nr:histidine kinase N-terminal 7TM domain-containing protein [Anaerolineaceae bacterium]
MALQLSIYSLVYLIAASVGAFSALIAWRRRSVPGGLWLFFLGISVIIWMLADSLEVSAVTLTDKIFWGKISYLGSAPVSVIIFFFALVFTHRTRWVTRRNVVLLSIIPALSIFAAFSNDWHHLLWNGFSFLSDNPAILVYSHGPLYWFFTPYVYVLIVLAALILAWFALRAHELYRYQSTIIISAILIPLMAKVAYDFSPEFLPGLDVPAFTITFSGLIFTLNMLRWKLLDVIPVARETLVDQLQDGVIVLDSSDRVVDLNRAARSLLGESDRPWIGQPARELFGSDLDLSTLKISDAPQEFSLYQPVVRQIEVRISGLFSQPGRMDGKLAVLRDITPRKQAEQALAESEAKFRLIFNAALDPILLLDDTNRIIDCNPAALKIFGAASREQVIGERHSKFSPERQLDDELSSAKADGIHHVLASEGQAQFEWLYRRLDQAEFMAEVAVAWVPMGDKKAQLVHLRDITERKLVEEKLRELSLVDALTGLNNRRGFMLLATQQLKTSDRLRQNVMLIYADLDGLKWINDNLGHNEGDRALVDTANILRNSFRASDIIARLGGDEFVGLGIEPQGNLGELILARLQEHLNAFNLQEDRPYKLSVSFGKAVYDPERPCS